jgi:hypothetical protein
MVSLGPTDPESVLGALGRSADRRHAHERSPENGE